MIFPLCLKISRGILCPLRFSNSRFMPSTVNESASHLSTSMSHGGCCFSLIILSFLSLYVYVKPLKRLFLKLVIGSFESENLQPVVGNPTNALRELARISSLSLTVAPAPAPRHQIQYNLHHFNLCCNQPLSVFPA